jgi:hypothetical protein
MANFTVGNSNPGGGTTNQGGAQWRGMGVTPQYRGRVQSYHLYMSSLDSDDIVSLGIGRDGAMITSQMELILGQTGFTADPGWIDMNSVTNPIVEAGRPYMLYFGVQTIGGDGFVTYHYDSPGTDEVVLLRNAGVTYPTMYLSSTSLLKYSVYADVKPIFENDYYYRKAITTDNTKVATDITQYQMLVSFTDNDLKSVANGGKVESNGGYDIIFEDEFGNKFDHQIDNYDPVTGAFDAWVFLPNLYNETNVKIYMYYGNPDITTTQENPAVVWDAASAVWHLQEGSGVSRIDSTGNGLTLTDSTTVASGTGNIGSGSDFIRANNEYLFRANNTLLNMGTGTFTASFWIKFDAPSMGVAVCAINMLDDFANPGLFPGWTVGKTAADNPFFFMYDGTTGDLLQGTDTTFVAGTWYHFAVARHSATDRRIYINGQLETTTTPASVGGSITNARQFNLGEYHGNGENLDGILDEVRIYKGVTFNQPHFETVYNNEVDPSTFYVVDAEQSPDTVVLGDYQYNRKITVNASEVFGASQPNYQVYVDITEDTLKSVANGGNVWFDDGRDITFGLTDDASNADKLPYHISDYDPVAGNVKAFVTLNSISGTINTSFYTHYGNRNAVSSTRNILLADRKFVGQNTILHGYLQQEPVSIYYIDDDDFTNTDGTTLTAHDSRWVSIFGGNAYIYNNQLRSNGDGLIRFGLNQSLLTPDQVVEADITIGSGTGSHTFEFYTRKDTAAGWNDAFIWRISVPTGVNPTATLSGILLQGGSENPQTSTNLGVISSQTYHIKILSIGERHSMYVDGVLRVQFNNGNLLNDTFWHICGLATNGPAGFAYNGADTYAIDNVQIYPQIGFATVNDTAGLKSFAAGEYLADQVPDIIDGQVSKALAMQGNTVRGIAPFEGNTATPQTIMAWVYRTSATGSSIYQKGTTSATFTNIEVLSTGFVVIQADGASTRLTSTSTIPLTTWTHVACVMRNTGVYEIYINGILDATDAGNPTGWTTGNDKPMNLGTKRSNVYTGFSGQVDELIHLKGIQQTSDFIRTYYNNTSSPATFLTIGAEGGPGASGGWVIFGDEGLVA